MILFLIYQNLYVYLKSCTLILQVLKILQILRVLKISQIFNFQNYLVTILTYQFNFKYLKYFRHSKYFYLTPVCPNPPAPLFVSSSSSTFCHSAFSCFEITSCAILSPSSTMYSSFETFTRITFISPR